MKKRSNKAPLTLAQYERLHNVIASLSERFARDQGRACVIYSILGAAVMHEHYRLSAKVICGSGAVMLDPTTRTFISWFKQNDDGSLTTGHDAFHAWIECNGWLIDLMAPNYREAMSGASPRDHAGQDVQAPTLIVPRMMLQKPIERTQGDLEKLDRKGDCLFVPDREVTSAVIDRAFERALFGDIINMALAWHRPTPLDIGESLTIQDDLGNVSTINLLRRELIGAW